MSRRIQTGTVSRPAPPGKGSAKHSEHATDFSFPDFEQLPLGPIPAPAPINSSSSSAVKADDYIDRLVKYVPTEIIALYLGATNAVPFRDPSRSTALWIIAGLCVVCTPIYMYGVTKSKDETTLWSQIAISSIAFPVWVFAIGGPFRSLPWYDEKQWIGAIVITFGTFLAGIYKPKPDTAAA